MSLGWYWNVRHRTQTAEHGFPLLSWRDTKPASGSGEFTNAGLALPPKRKHTRTSKSAMLQNALGEPASRVGVYVSEFPSFDLGDDGGAPNLPHLSIFIGLLEGSSVASRVVSSAFG